MLELEEIASHFTLSYVRRVPTTDPYTSRNSLKGKELHILLDQFVYISSSDTGKIY